MAAAVASRPTVSIPSWFDYNAQAQQSASQQESSFNPILVRLQQPVPRVAVVVDTSFQSHLGSITTLYVEYMTVEEIEVSIPSWFDYNWRRMISASAAVMRFNPILVRLQRGGYPHGLGTPRRFQSHLGSITTRLGSRTEPSRASVSIPSWFDYNLA